MVYFIAGFISALLLTAVSVLLLSTVQITLHHPDVPHETPTLSEEQTRDFSEADQKATQDFLSSLADLNAFMTGKDRREEIRNVGEQ